MRFVLVAMIGVSGCYSSFAEYADEREGGDIPDVDVADDCDGSVDADTSGDASTCEGTWLDPTTGYLWENPPSDTIRNWDDAVTYCHGLALCGYPVGAWHLPTISELRSLIRGCPDTMLGGTCGVIDSCLDNHCWSSACFGCSWLGGSGSDGCYWDPTVGGGCYWYWSSSSHAGSASYAWGLAFGSGNVTINVKATTYAVRCVRPGP